MVKKKTISYNQMKLFDYKKIKEEVRKNGILLHVLYSFLTIALNLKRFINDFFVDQILKFSY